MVDASVPPAADTTDVCDDVILDANMRVHARLLETLLRSLGSFVHRCTAALASLPCPRTITGATVRFDSISLAARGHPPECEENGKEGRPVDVLHVVEKWQNAEGTLGS